jgi:hypothetical protein
VALDDIADELYRLPPSDFTAAREERVKEARQTGDRELAAAIHSLRKPSAGAWLANLLVRERGEEVDQLLQLGAALREAQQGLAGEDLRALSRQRHQVINALTREARTLARDAGGRVSSDTALELEGTLEAALSDEDAAAALRAGRLTTPMRPGATGFGIPSSDTGFGGRSSDTAAPPAKQPSLRLVKGSPKRAKSDEAKEKAERDRLRDERAAADRAVRAAEQDDRAARETAEAAAAAVDRESTEAEQVRRRIEDLEAEIGRLKGDESLARRNLHRLEKERDTTARRAVAARKRLERAQAARSKLD